MPSGNRHSKLPGRTETIRHLEQGREWSNAWLALLHSIETDLTKLFLVTQHHAGLFGLVDRGGVKNSLLGVFFRHERLYLLPVGVQPALQFRDFFLKAFLVSRQ